MCVSFLHFFPLSSFPDHLSLDEMPANIIGKDFLLSDIKLFSLKVCVHQKRAHSVVRSNTTSLRIVCR